MSDQTTEQVPTNRDLAERIEALGAELGVEVRPAGNKAKLLEQLEELKRLKEERSAMPPAPPEGAVRAGGEPPNSSGPPQAVRVSYQVAPGRSVISAQGGVLGPGQAVNLADIRGGAEYLQTLVRTGVLLRG